ncbi:MAG TPA: cyanophycin synthetase [Bacteroidales bacterium]|nr:cyanophycin synthetase [Bacteroidales bacterium]
MKILDIHVLRGPNYWSARRSKLIVLKLDLEDMEHFPTNRIPGFYARLRKKIPTLYNHYCSEGFAGGFFERVKSGTWMGHVIEHIAIEMQTLAGMECSFGRTRQVGEQKGIYNVVFEYHEEKAGVYVSEAAVRVADALIHDKYFDLQEDIDKLKAIHTEFSVGPSTSSILEAATARGIPHIRLDEGSLFQLGYGIKQQRINATITGQTSSIGVDIASDKYLTKKILKDAAVPISPGVMITHESELHDAIREIGFPLVVKPLDSNHGNGVTTHIQTADDALLAYSKAMSFSKKVIVERYYTGEDFRLLVINYKFAAAAHRLPAKVIGDGTSTIKELIDKANKSPVRGDDHEKILTRIKIDDHTREVLERQGFTLKSVPRAGKSVLLKQTANLSTGGTSEDVTDQVHPEIVQMAERTARAIGLDICGIDMVLSDIDKPLKDNGVVLEVNAAPGFRMHTHPSCGIPRPVGENVVNMLFPDRNENGRIPITAITGTNGKTTTTRLMAHIAKIAGYNVGYTTTEGIHIGDTLLEEGDCTGPVSAGKILCDKTVDFAVLECARGGILRSGLAFDTCDVGIVTNVAEDHIGLGDIESIDDMAHVKALIPESVKAGGYAVLNADNHYTYRMKNKVKCNVALFSTKPYSERVDKHCKAGGLAAIYEKGNIVLVKGTKKTVVEHVENIPLSFGGRAQFMIENILAATLAGYIQKISIADIVRALRTFVPSVENTPGRLNTFRFNDFTLMVDYAHNYHGLTALGSLIKQWDAAFKLGIISAAGDRRDVDIINMGIAAAEIFDKIVIRIDEDRRGRTAAEIVNLLSQGIRMVKPDIQVEIIPDEIHAMTYAINNTPPHSLIVNLSEKVRKCIDFAKNLQVGNALQKLRLIRQEEVVEF